MMSNRTMFAAAAAWVAMTLSFGASADPPPFPSAGSADDPYEDGPAQRPLTREEKARRKALVDEGMKLIEKEKWKEASEKLHAAANLQVDAELLVWRGYAENNLGKLVHARRLYDLARTQAKREKRGDVETRAKQSIEALDKVLPRMMLKLPGEVPVTVYVDDAKVRYLSEGIAVDPGSHTLQVTAEGRQEYRSRVLIREGEAQTIEVLLPRITAIEPEVPKVPPSSGCSCTSPGGDASRATGLLPLGLLGLVFRRRSRR